jgi:hypothetical protein
MFLNSTLLFLSQIYSSTSFLLGSLAVRFNEVFHRSHIDATTLAYNVPSRDTSCISPLGPAMFADWYYATQP